MGAKRNRCKRRIDVIHIPKIGAAIPIPQINQNSHTWGYNSMGNWDYILRHKENQKVFSNHSTYGSALMKKGYKALGRGAFSTVYGKDGFDKVIKVTRTEDNWIDYIQWAAKNGYCGTFAPRVYSYKKTEKFSVSVVERMEKTASSLREAEDLSFAADLAKTYIRGKNLIAGVFLEELIPGMADFLSRLNDEFVKDEKEERLDMHGGNFMVRKDGSFCFTDPVCGKTQITSNRLKAKDFTSLATANRIFYEFI